MSKTNVNPNHYKVAGRARQGEDIAQIRHKQKYAEALVRERTGKSARSRTPAGSGKASPDVGPTRPAKPAQNTHAVPMAAAPAMTAKQATKPASVNLQGGDKRGKRSTAQKRASSRHEFGPMPATKAVAGAFGKEPSPRRRPPQKG